MRRSVRASSDARLARSARHAPHAGRVACASPRSAMHPAPQPCSRRRAARTRVEPQPMGTVQFHTTPLASRASQERGTKGGDREACEGQADGRAGAPRPAVVRGDRAQLACAHALGALVHAERQAERSQGQLSHKRTPRRNSRAAAGLRRGVGTGLVARRRIRLAVGQGVAASAHITAGKDCQRCFMNDTRRLTS